MLIDIKMLYFFLLDMLSFLHASYPYGYN